MRPVVNFGGATFILGADFTRQGQALKDGGFGDVSFSKIGDDAALFTSDLELEKRYRGFLDEKGIKYAIGQATSFDEYQRTRF